METFASKRFSFVIWNRSAKQAYTSKSDGKFVFVHRNIPTYPFRTRTITHCTEMNYNTIITRKEDFPSLSCTDWYVLLLMERVQSFVSTGNRFPVAREYSKRTSLKGHQPCLSYNIRKPENQRCRLSLTMVFIFNRNRTFIVCRWFWLLLVFIFSSSSSAEWECRERGGRRESDHRNWWVL